MTSRSNDGASPMVSIGMPRTQAEMLLKLVREQPQRKWDPVLKNLLDGLRWNAGSRVYTASAAVETLAGLRKR